jgi:hypothetical protein
MQEASRLIIAAAVAAFVYAYLTRTEPYIPMSVDVGEWRAVQNDTRRKSGPFNTCSPESFGGLGGSECPKMLFSNLSRY